MDGIVAGNRCAIGAGVQLHPGTKLGDDVFFGPRAIACNDVWPSVDKNGWELPTGGKYTVVVEDGASIGAGAILLPGAHIKKGALVAAGAVCSRVVSPGAVYQRNNYTAPQRPLDWQKRRMRWVT